MFSLFGKLIGNIFVRSSSSPNGKRKCASANHETVEENEDHKDCSHPSSSTPGCSRKKRKICKCNCKDHDQDENEAENKIKSPSECDVETSNSKSTPDPDKAVAEIDLSSVIKNLESTKSQLEIILNSISSSSTSESTKKEEDNASDIATTSIPKTSSDSTEMKPDKDKAIQNIIELLTSLTKDDASSSPPTPESTEEIKPVSAEPAVDSKSSDKKDTKLETTTTPVDILSLDPRMPIPPDTEVAFVDDNEGSEAPTEDPKEPLDTELIMDLSIQLDKIEGLESQTTFVREEMLFPFINRDTFISAGLPVERGFLFHGSSHGMIPVIKGLANELSRKFGKTTRIFARSSMDIFPRYSSNAGQYIKRIINSVKKLSSDTPVIVLIQDLRSFLNFCEIFKRIDQTNESVLVAALAHFIGKESKNKKVIFIGTVDELGLVPKSSMGPGKFAKTVSFPKEGNDCRRKSFLRKATETWKFQPDDEILQSIAKKTLGFSPEELLILTQNAFQKSLSTCIKDTGDNNCCSKCKFDTNSLKVDETTVSSVNPTLEHWEAALEKMQEERKIFKEWENNKSDSYSSYSRNETSTNDTPTVDPLIDFSSIGGLEEQIKYLKDNIILPLKKKDILKEWGVEPVRGIIFHGPPGTGKTLLARAMANEMNQILTQEPINNGNNDSTKSNSDKKNKKTVSFFYRKATDCFNKYIGESERILRDLFSSAEKSAPSLIFFDEFDGLCATRDLESCPNQFYATIVTTLLGLMDGVKRGDVLVIAATNRLSLLDPAMRRAGRFDRSVGFPMPGIQDRENILRIHTKAWKNGNAQEVLQKMAEKTVGYSGADLEQLVRQTFVHGMQRLLKDQSSNLEIQEADWFTALSETRPSSSKSEKGAFGISSTILEKVPPGVHHLLQENISILEKKFQPLFTSIEDNKGKNNAGGLNSFIISGGEDVESYLVPLLLSESKYFKEISSYSLDLGEVGRLTKDSILNTFCQLNTAPDGKIPLLFVPSLDKFVKYKGTMDAAGIVDFTFSQLSALRGKNIILLATSGLTLKEMQERGSEEYKDILALFKDVEGSKSHEYLKPSQKELKSFFASTFAEESSEELDMSVEFGNGKDVGTLLDLNSEIRRILTNCEKKEEKKTEVIKQLKSLFKAFEQNGVQEQMQLDMYI